MLERLKAKEARLDALQGRLAREAAWREKLIAQLHHRVVKTETLRKRTLALRQRLQDHGAELKTLRQKAAVGGEGDDLSLTTGWPRVTPLPAPFVIGERARIKVLMLNSLAGIGAHLSKALMLHEGIEADCLVAASKPRRFLAYPHETNLHGVFTHEEWRSYMEWAVGNYDIVQSISLPFWPAVAECYDWLTETLGRRHIWTETGSVHHYLLREDVLPLGVYQSDYRDGRVPGPGQFAGRTFTFGERHIHTDPYVMFYSSPEKGAYFEGKDAIWLPCIRDPELYRPESAPRPVGEGPVRVYVPAHQSAMWKGLKEIMAVLDGCIERGMPIQVVTSTNAAETLPELSGLRGSTDAVYPQPIHMMPILLQSVDLVIDQIVMGSYGNTGIEAMFTGKPVLGQKRYAEIAEAPVVPIEADTLESVLRDLLGRRQDWPALGAAGRDYAQRVHSPQAVAKVAADVYRRVMDEQRH